MKKFASFLLVGIVVAVVYFFLLTRGSPPSNQIPIETSPTRARSIDPFTNASLPTSRRARTERSSDSLASLLTTLRSELRQWQESGLADPDDDEGRDRLLAEMLGMLTDETVVDVIQSLSAEELDTPFGIGALHHWMRLNAVAATDWLAARPDSTSEEMLAVAEDWTADPDALQRYVDQLPASAWKQNFLEQASSSALSSDPAEAIKLATEFMQIAGDGKGEILAVFDQGGPPPR